MIILIGTKNHLKKCNAHVLLKNYQEKIEIAVKFFNLIEIIYKR